MKYSYLLVLIPLLFISGCVSMPENNSTMNNTQNIVVASGDKIAVDYRGYLENGTVFDTSVGRAPLEFIAGAGQMIKGFDAAVIGMKMNEEKTVTIKPEDAYGLSDPKNIVDVLIENLPNNTKAGDVLYSGTQRVVVVSINSTSALVDFNHFLAGKTLIFDIRIVRIEKSSPA